MQNPGIEPTAEPIREIRQPVYALDKRTPDALQSGFRRPLFGKSRGYEDFVVVERECQLEAVEQLDEARVSLGWEALGVFQDDAQVRHPEEFPPLGPRGVHVFSGHLGHQVAQPEGIDEVQVAQHAARVIVVQDDTWDTIESDQFRICPAAPPQILHNTVCGRTWLYIACSDVKMIILQILTTSHINVPLKGWENVLF